MRGTHVPFPFESLKVNEGIRDRLITEIGCILLEQPVAQIRVLRFGKRVLVIGFFQPVERDDYAVDLCERVIQVAFLGCG